MADFFVFFFFWTTWSVVCTSVLLLYLRFTGNAVRVCIIIIIICLCLWASKMNRIKWQSIFWLLSASACALCFVYSKWPVVQFSGSGVTRLWVEWWNCSFKPTQWSPKALDWVMELFLQTYPVESRGFGLSDGTVPLNLPSGVLRLWIEWLNCSFKPAQGSPKALDWVMELFL